MDSCDSRFSQALHGGLGAFVRTESDAFLLQSVSGIGKARQALAGSLLLLANGEWAHIPLTGASLTGRAGQLSVVVRPSSGKEDKKVKLSLLGSTATHILPGVLSSHLDTEHRFFKEGAGAKNLREFDGDAPVRLLVSKLATGKLEILRHYVDGGDMQGGEATLRSCASRADAAHRSQVNSEQSSLGTVVLLVPSSW